MKQLLTVLLIAKACIGQAQSIEESTHILDSLSNEYGRRVIGYHRSITINPIPRQTFIYYYVDEKGETMFEQAWARELKSDPGYIATASKQTTATRHNNLPANATAVYHSNSYIGYIENGLFTKLTVEYPNLYAAMSSKAKTILNNQKALDNYLRSIYSSYYIKTIN